MSESIDYPPEPWDLRGHLHVSAWAVPVRELPELPPGVRPLVVAGRALVLAAWVDYRPPGVLSYRELMVTVVVRGGLTVTIPHIPVGSPASLAGGRALWHIPKELAEFTLTDGPEFTAEARVGGDAAAGEAPAGGDPVARPEGSAEGPAGGDPVARPESAGAARAGAEGPAGGDLLAGPEASGETPAGGEPVAGRPSAEAGAGGDPEAAGAAPARGDLLAAAGFRARRVLPVRVPLAFSVLQRGPRRSGVRVAARLGVARSVWRVGAGGPLAFLAGRRPLVSLVARDFRMRFGGDRANP
ncbi:acetoacetate decarboxylase family protein [Amycolatopsis thermalba]|uniref:acetoacetate decarboxylase family protein n=1 Tax=Amycolatopsis thermalba TaxID=944492 RepID=UPI001FCA0975|nr:acetoacetate decarboxylase family protein [Amycolatopsis thermalba]